MSCWASAKDITTQTRDALTAFGGGVVAISGDPAADLLGKGNDKGPQCLSCPPTPVPSTPAITPPKMVADIADQIGQENDIRDIWRLFAVCHKTGVTPEDWASPTAKTARQILAALMAIDSKPLSFHFPERRLRAQLRALAKATAG